MVGRDGEALHAIGGQGGISPSESSAAVVAVSLGTIVRDDSGLTRGDGDEQTTKRREY
jgi:hypothetical protein